MPEHGKRKTWMDPLGWEHVVFFVDHPSFIAYIYLHVFSKPKCLCIVFFYMQKMVANHGDSDVFLIQPPHNNFGSGDGAGCRTVSKQLFQLENIDP